MKACGDVWGERKRCIGGGGDETTSRQETDRLETAALAPLGLRLGRRLDPNYLGSLLKSVWPFCRAALRGCHCRRSALMDGMDLVRCAAAIRPLAARQRRRRAQPAGAVCESWPPGDRAGGSGLDDYLCWSLARGLQLAVPRDVEGPGGHPGRPNQGNLHTVRVVAGLHSLECCPVTTAYSVGRLVRGVREVPFLHKRNSNVPSEVGMR